MCKVCNGDKLHYESFEELPQELKDKCSKKLNSKGRKGFVSFINELNKRDDKLIGDYNGNQEKTKIKLCSCGHTTLQTPNTYKTYRGCGVCKGLQVQQGVNDLATTHPHLVKEWHPTKNGDLTPQQITFGSDKRVWWICEHGHEWDVTINSRLQGNGCPYCGNQRVLEGFNDLVTKNPLLAQEWHPTKNCDLLPTMFTSGSGKRVWWLGECGHEWDATIYKRSSMGRGCPYCSNHKVLKGYNDIATTDPDLVKFFTNPNDAYTHTRGSGDKVDMICPDCGHEKLQTISTLFAQGFGCPHCGDGISYPEKVVALILEVLKIKFKRQYKFDEYKYKYDFYLIDFNTIIEVHGGQHYKDCSRNSSWKSYEDEHENDMIKYDLAVLHGYEHNKNYFVIDARYSNIEHMRNSIEQCKIFEQFNLDNIDWQDIDKQAQSSLRIEICRYWKEQKEINKDLTTTDLTKEFKVYTSTIVKYLTWGNENGYCEYNGQEEKEMSWERVKNKATKKAHEKSMKPVYLIDENEQVLLEAQSRRQMGKLLNMSEETVSRKIKSGEPLKYSSRAKYDKKYIGCILINQNI